MDSPAQPDFDLAACRETLARLESEVALLSEASNTFADLAERLNAQVLALRGHLITRAPRAEGLTPINPE
jgi:primosomal protein N''